MHILIYFFILRYLLFVFMFLILGYILGKVVLKGNFLLHDAVGSFYYITFGWGCLAILIMILGFSGLLYKPILFLMLISIIFIPLFLRKRCIRFHNFLPENNIFLYDKLNLMVYFFILAYFLLLFYSALFPVTEFDSTLCHLPIAQHFINKGSFVINPFIRYDPPYMMNLFFVFSLMFGDDVSASLTQYAMAMALCVFIYSFGKQYVGKNTGFLALVIFICSPLVSYFSAVPYIETGAALFCFSGFYAMLLWARKQELKFAVIGAVLWGIAIGSKYYSILFFVISFLTIIIAEWRKIRKPVIVITILIVILIACPWYLRNKYYTGDGFFPLLLNETNNKGLWSLYDAREDVKHIQSHGCGKDIQSLFMLPINLLSHSDKFGVPSVGIFLVFSFLSVIFLHKMPNTIKVIFIVSALYGFIWFKYFPVIRYLFPILPFLALLSAWFIYKCSFENKRLIFIMTGIVLISGFNNIIKIIADKGKVPVTISEKNNYLRKCKPTYGAIDYLNKIADQATVVYALYDEESFYFHKNKIMGDWFGPARFSDIMPYLEQPLKDRDFIKKYNIRYVLINKQGEESFRCDKFRVIYEDKNSFVIDTLGKL